MREKHATSAEDLKMVAHVDFANIVQRFTTSDSSDSLDSFHPDGDTEAEEFSSSQSEEDSRCPDRRALVETPNRLLSTRDPSTSSLIDSVSSTDQTEETMVDFRKGRKRVHRPDLWKRNVQKAK